MNQQLMQPDFNHLEPSVKLALMERIAKRYGLEFLGMQTFERYGKSCSTGRFVKSSHRALEWVLVPGATVTLGWECFVGDLNDEGKAELEGLFDEWGERQDITNFIGSFMCPVREVTIGPMLVATELQEVGYEAIELEDKRLSQKERQLFKDYMSKSKEGVELNLHHRARLVKEGASYQAYLYQDITYPSLKEHLASQGLSLPTADEWAYLCGGGCRTLFPWGEGITESLKLYHFADSNDDRHYDLHEPNFFGLAIGYDPYKREIVDSLSFTTCGGDGGCNICGGMGPLIGYLPCAPHCKPQIHKVELINNDYDFYRPIIRVALED